MKNLIKNKRGFSLIELMVVVAIMGTLAAIAIPAYNEYRKSAKKVAYIADMTSLHKGWQAFGVELDSYCERETEPENASISHVGMESLTTSKLYGLKGAALVECTGTCTAGTPSGSLGAGIHPVGSTCASGCTAGTVSGNGPGKHNFIGFGDNDCTNITNINEVQIVGADTGGIGTTHDVLCDLDVDEYEMGVWGHISGKEYFGVSINHNGVLSDEEINTTATTAVTNCTT